MRRWRPFSGVAQHFCSNTRRLHEILAGARDEADYREYHEDWVAPFEDLQRVITPSQITWTRGAYCGSPGPA